MPKHRIQSAPHYGAAAITTAPGRWTYPKNTIARTLAGTAQDLDRAARLRRAGCKTAARDTLAFARDARLFAPAARLPG